MRPEKTIWIVHQRPERRAALVRLVQSRLPIVSGAPGEAVFDSAPAPRAVLLGLEGDFEAELDFVHRVAGRYRGCAFVLIAEPEDHADARRLFDTLRPTLLPWPPSPSSLAELLGDTVQRDRTVSLSRRRQRETVTERFVRWFGEMESGALLRSVDPRLVEVPLLVRGEEGTGRALLARYLHAIGPDPHTAFLRVQCGPSDYPGELIAQLAEGEPHFAEATVLLSGVDRLAHRVQAEVADWVEFGLPFATGLERVRWIATAGAMTHGEGALLPELERRLAGLVVPLSPLREQPETIERFVQSTLRAFALRREQHAPQLAPEALEILCTHPWPGNRAELEAVLIRSLSRCDGSQLLPSDLLFEGDPIESPDGHRPHTPTPERSEPALESTPDTWPAVVGAVAREVNAPLDSIRAFTNLLDDHHDDAEFRARFDELVGGDIHRIEEVIEALGEFVALRRPAVSEVDLAEILQRQVASCATQQGLRNVRIATEFDRDDARVLADPALLETAIAGLLRRAVSWLPESGEIFLASHHHKATADRAAHGRILLRFEIPPRGAGAEENPFEIERIGASFEFVAARAVVEALGGAFTMNPGPAREVLLVVDLPAPDPT